MASRDPLSVRVYGNSHGSHDHPHFQILFGLDGALELEVDGRGYRIATGDGRVVPPGARHDFEARTGSRCLVLDSTDVDWSRQPVVPVKSPALQRLAHAQHLQRQGQSVAESARRCGYRSPSALTAAMRRQNGA